MMLPRLVLVVLLSLTLCHAADESPSKTTAAVPATRRLPHPQLDKAAPLMTALQQRRTTREMSPGALTEQQLSDILWCADGVNRPPNGRTAPSALSVYPVEIYVVLPEGIYLYDPTRHELKGVAAGDLRNTMGGQDFAVAAPLNLVFVMDAAKYQNVAAAAKSAAEDQARWAALEAGSQAQNIYLYCAAEKLAAVIRAGVDTSKFTAAAGLRPTQKIIVAQTVGRLR